MGLEPGQAEDDVFVIDRGNEELHRYSDLLVIRSKVSVKDCIMGDKASCVDRSIRVFGFYRFLEREQGYLVLGRKVFVEKKTLCSGVQ